MTIPVSTTCTRTVPKDARDRVDLPLSRLETTTVNEKLKQVDLVMEETVSTEAPWNHILVPAAALKAVSVAEFQRRRLQQT